MQGKKKPLNAEIGRRIQISREQAGLTQEALAERLDLSTQFLSTVERGVAGASVETIVKLCGALNVSSDWLLLGKRSAPTAQSIASRLEGLNEHELMLFDRLTADLMLLLKEK